MILLLAACFASGCCPGNTAWNATEVVVALTFGGAEVEDCTILSDEQFAGSRLKLFATVAAGIDIDHLLLTVLRASLLHVLSQGASGCHPRG